MSLNLHAPVNIKNIILDFGNVIFEYRHLQLIEYIRINFGLENGKDYDAKIIWYNLGKQGLKPEDIEFFEQKVKLLNLPISGIDLQKIYFNFNKYFSEAESFIGFLKQKRCNFYYLTNSSELNFKSRVNSNIFKYFAGGLASFETDYKKPNPEIYTRLISKYDLKIEETVFIDDKLENIETAKQIGIKSFRIQWPKEFKILEKEIICLNSLKFQSANQRKDGIYFTLESEYVANHELNTVIDSLNNVELYDLKTTDVDEMIEIQKQTDIKSYVNNKYNLTVENILEYDWEGRKLDRKEQIQDQNYLWVALKKDNKIVAYGCLGNLDKKIINMYNIIVAPESQNQRLGSFMVNYLLQKAPLKNIELETTVARDFYKKFGFRSFENDRFKMYLNKEDLEIYKNKCEKALPKT